MPFLVLSGGGAKNRQALAQPFASPGLHSPPPIFFVWDPLLGLPFRQASLFLERVFLVVLLVFGFCSFLPVCKKEDICFATMKEMQRRSPLSSRVLGPSNFQGKHRGFEPRDFGEFPRATFFVFFPFLFFSGKAVRGPCITSEMLCLGYFRKLWQDQVLLRVPILKFELGAIKGYLDPQPTHKNWTPARNLRQPMVLTPLVRGLQTFVLPPTPNTRFFQLVFLVENRKMSSMVNSVPLFFSKVGRQLIPTEKKNAGSWL